MFKPGTSEEDRDKLKYSYLPSIFNLKYTLADAFASGQSRYIKSESTELDRHGDADRHVKGLKQLSKKVLEVVQTSEPLSYREVASQLIIDSDAYLCALQKSEREKEEKNIKRRVYDALNVLIASRVLLKQGKKVTSNVSEGELELAELKAQIAEREKRIASKTAETGELQSLQSKIATLYDRNRSNSFDKYIQMPVYVAVAGKKRILEQDTQHRSLTLKSVEPILFLNDVEVLRRLL